MTTIDESQQQSNLADTFVRVEGECIKSFSTLLSQAHDEFNYLNMRRLYVLTKGQSAIRINKSINKLYGDGDQSTQSKAICESLVKGGGYLSARLYNHEPDMDDICNMLDNYGEVNEGSSRAWVREWSILKQNKLVREISRNPLYRQVADEYLGCKSILNSVVAWKTSYNEINDEIRLSNDALMFHFDLDTNRLLKIFVYLSDVDEKCGPHTYIEDTNATSRFKLPQPLQRDGRLKSSEVINCGLVPKYVVGERGTILFGDTTNLHKGTPVRLNNSRYILQLVFVDSIFGAKNSNSADDLMDMNHGIER